MSARRKKTTIWQTALEINNTSFWYYLAIFLALLVCEIFWPGDFVFHYLRFPLEWLAVFVFLSGFLKLFFNKKFRKYWKSWLLRFRKAFPDLAAKIARLVRAGEKNITIAGHELFKEQRVIFLFIFSLILYLSLLLWQDFLSIDGFKKFLAFSQKPAVWLFDSKASRLDWFLGLVIITGFWAFLFSPSMVRLSKKRPARIESTKRNFVGSLMLIVGFGMASGFVIFFKTQSLGLAAYFLAILFGLLLMFLSAMILYGKKEDI